MVIKFKFDLKLVLLTSIYISIAVGALLIAFPSTSVWIPSNSSELAAWVQAVGAIAAIGSGFYLARYQISEGLKNQEAHEKESLRQLNRKRYFLLASKVLDVKNFARTTVQSEKRWMTLWPLLNSECLKLMSDIESIDADDFPKITDILELNFLQMNMKTVHRILSDDFLSPTHSLVAFNLLKKKIDELYIYSEKLHAYYLNALAGISTDEEKANDRQAVLDAATRMKIG